MSIAIDEAPIIEPVCDEIDCVEQIDPQTFYRKYIVGNRPVVITGMMDSWKAMQRWSFEYFQNLKSDSTVHIEQGNILQGQTDFQKETFAQYIDRLIQDDGSMASSGAYLSVFKIFQEFPDLEEDVDFSLINQFKLKHSTVGWLGPAGTVTGYHIDWGDNILAQIHGRKCLHLASPRYTPNMYVSQKFDQGTTISEVDFDHWDAEKHPRFLNVRHHKIVLNPGQMLFIPRGWWHHVRSLDKSISVSNLTYDARGIMMDAAPHRLKQILHNWGIWKCDCTCHVHRDGKWVRK